jgi:hypothetical protein
LVPAVPTMDNQRPDQAVNPETRRRSPLSLLR